ncbi:MAG: type II toxin-antitoxin system HicB family antitoxin [Polyangiaceae bacterium]
MNKSKGAQKIADKYSYRVIWSPEDDEHVGLCAELPSLSWLAGSQVGALKGIHKLVSEVVHDMQKNKEQIPVPLSERAYSGQFKVRIPPFLHRQLVLEAEENHVSLNRLISAKLASG